MWLQLVSCTSRFINLQQDDINKRDKELTRILASSLKSFVLLEEDIPRFMDALEDPSPKMRQVAVRLLSLRPNPEIASAIAEKLTDPDADVRYEASVALQHFGIEYKEIIFEAAINPDLTPKDRQDLTGCIAHFGKEGETLLIRMLAEDDEAVAHTAARNLKRLYPLYPPEPLMALIKKDTPTSAYSASAWLASYPEKHAVRQQLLYTINPNPKVSLRARTLYLAAGSWCMAITQNLLETKSLTQPSIRALMIQKLLASDSDAAANYLLEYFSYKTNTHASLIASYIDAHTDLAKPILRRGLMSNKTVICHQSLYFLQNFLDKTTLASILPLLEHSDPEMYHLARDYVKKANHKFPKKVASYFDPQRHSVTDITLFRILLADNTPELLWSPHTEKLNAARLFYFFQNTTEQEVQTYFQTLHKPLYVLHLGLLQQIYQLGKQHQKNQSHYTNNPIVKQTLHVAQLGLQQEKIAGDIHNLLLIDAIQEWYNIQFKASSTEKTDFSEYQTQISSLYHLYIGLPVEYREIAQDILKYMNIAIENIRAIMTYTPTR